MNQLIIKLSPRSEWPMVISQSAYPGTMYYKWKHPFDRQFCMTVQNPLLRKCNCLTWNHMELFKITLHHVELNEIIQDRVELHRIAWYYRESHSLKKRPIHWSAIIAIIIIMMIMYIYHDLINALNAHNHMIHIKHKHNSLIETVMLYVHIAVNPFWE